MDHATLNTRVFRWTASETIERPTSMFDTSPAISPDGSVIVGVSPTLGFQAYRWTVGGDFRLLGDLPGGPTNSAATDVTSNGAVVVGYGTAGPPNDVEQAFQWTEATGMVGLGGLPGARIQSLAWGVSADGSVVVGYAFSPGPDARREAFRWSGSMVGLGILPNASSSIARRVSTDGSVVVGVSDFPTVPAGSMNFHSEAFRWTQADGMVSLGDLAGGRVRSVAYDVSADGSVIVGAGETSFENGVGISEAFYWTSATGMLNLRDVLISGGATGVDGWTLTEVRGVSWDGLTVVGSGINPSGATEAFVATIPEPSTIVLGVVAAAALVALLIRGLLRGRIVAATH